MHSTSKQTKHTPEVVFFERPLERDNATLEAACICSAQARPEQRTHRASQPASSSTQPKQKRAAPRNANNIATRSVTNRISQRLHTWAARLLRPTACDLDCFAVFFPQPFGSNPRVLEFLRRLGCWNSLEQKPSSAALVFVYLVQLSTARKDCSVKAQKRLFTIVTITEITHARV